MDTKGRRQSTNIEDRRGQKFVEPPKPRYNQLDSTLDSAVFHANGSKKLSDKALGKVAEAAIKARKTLGYRNYAKGGFVRGDGCCAKGKTKGKFY